MFSISKRAIFRKVKEIKHFCGGILWYAAQRNVKIDAGIAEKGRFGMETRLVLSAQNKNEGYLA